MKVAKFRIVAATWDFFLLTAVFCCVCTADSGGIFIRPGDRHKKDVLVGLEISWLFNDLFLGDYRWHIVLL
jgi:hypothetical protein